ncbi:2TM domain-containing protein [Poritiphilus flavus]|uniref:Histidine kinase n=1 Tax=Poritiphilus flavus TaxID=2697053 RepID=A0A6L9EAL4_9FLAO|nr:2TM domain-containing protein [Poritiphilus flavus]NAS11598.1 histidine kinase [Poritiphilus flavus]
MENFRSDDKYLRAKERVEAIKGFYCNLTAYCIIIPLLIMLNLWTTSFPWVLFPIVGWGFGLVMHGIEAYNANPLWGKRWENKKIKELMEKEDF